MQIMRAVVALSSVVMALLFVQCIATKKTDNLNSKVDSSASANTHREVSDNSTLTNKSTIADNSITQDTTAETITTITYSKPDSTGKQYVESLTTVDRHTGTRKSINKNTSIDTAAQLDIDINEDTESKANKTGQFEFESSQTLKTKTPIWVWISAGLISIGLIVLAYLVLKRYKLVK